MRRIRSQQSFPDHGNYTSLTKVAKLYKDKVIQDWINERRDSPELYFIDTIADHYSNIMQGLPRLTRALMSQVLCTYHRGITPTEIAKRLFKPVQTVTSTLQRLSRADLVERSKSTTDRRQTTYKVLDADWLRAYAIRSDGRFYTWSRDKDLKKMQTPISDFMYEVE